MEIDGAITDSATTGNTDDGLAALGEERAENADAGAHGFDDVVAGFALAFIADFDIEGAVEDRATGDALAGWIVAEDIATELTNELGHGIDIRKSGNTVEGGFPLGHEGGGDNRKRGVFAAADFDFAF